MYFPHLIERYTGIDQRYYIAKFAPNSLIVKILNLLKKFIIDITYEKFS